MNRGFQQVLLAAYRAAAATGLVDTRVGRRLFESAYAFYKLRFEAGDLEPLREFVHPGTTVVDVGANIGLFALRFARWVTPPGVVLAVEPEPRNRERLVERARSCGVADRIQTIQAAACDRDGPVFLERSPTHPGDHRLADSGMAIEGITVDTLVERAGAPPVSLLKIDVQGAEAMVIAGAARTLTRDRPVLHVELDDRLLRRFGSTSTDLLETICARGYRAHLLERGRLRGPLGNEETLRAHDARGYLDVVMLPDPAHPVPR